MRVIGIDPGSVSGAGALLDTNDPQLICVFDLPVVADGLDPAQLTRVFRNFDAHMAVVERVSAMPGQGVSSMFKFGRAYGTILGVLAALEVPTHLVTPVVWKKHFGLPGKDKERAREFAIRMFPQVSGLSRKKDAGRAEALLISKWFLEHHKK